jgi:hypothetical protein
MLVDWQEYGGLARYQLAGTRQHLLLDISVWLRRQEVPAAPSPARPPLSASP